MADATELALVILELEDKEDSNEKMEEMGKLLKLWEVVYSEIRTVVQVIALDWEVLPK